MAPAYGAKAGATDDSADGIGLAVVHAFDDMRAASAPRGPETVAAAMPIVRTKPHAATRRRPLHQARVAVSADMAGNPLRRAVQLPGAATRSTARAHHPTRTT